MAAGKTRRVRVAIVPDVLVTVRGPYADLKFEGGDDTALDAGEIRALREVLKKALREIERNAR